MLRRSSRIIYMKFKTRFHAGDLGGLVVVNFLDSNALY